MEERGAQERSRWPVDLKNPRTAARGPRGWVGSPELWASAVCATALIAFGLPPAIYEGWAGEPTYAYANWLLLAYIGIGLALFVAGAAVGRFVMRRFSRRYRAGSRDDVAPSSLSWWVVCITACTIEFVRIAVLLAQLGLPEASELRSVRWRIEAAEALGRLNLGLVGFSAKAMWLWCLDSAREIGARGGLLRSLSVVGVLVGGMAAVAGETLIGHRGPLFVLLVGIVLSLLGRGDSRDSSRRLPSLTVVAAGSAGLLVWYGVLGLAGYRITEAINLLALYIVTAWNRAGAVISGSVRLAREGSGERVLEWLYYLPGLDLRDLWSGIVGIELPDPGMAWAEQFEELARQGLNGSFIWLTVFGSVYLDMGWWGGLWFAGQGTLIGALAELRRLRWARLLLVWLMSGIAGWFAGILVAKPWGLLWVTGVVYAEVIAAAFRTRGRVWSRGRRRART
jgi:hypothetical protein